MTELLDIHTHREAPYPEGLVSVRPDAFNPIEGQRYSVGIHPWDTSEEVPAALWDRLAEAALHPSVAAIGECGIDMLRGGPLFRQLLVMKRHVELSEAAGKPLVIHCVRAHDAVIGLKREMKPRQNWAVHGFRGKPSVMRMLADAGIWLSFGVANNPESVKAVPKEKMLAETDESPQGILEVVASLSKARNEDLLPQIELNTRRFLLR